MDLHIHTEKRYLVFLAVLVCLLFLIGVSAAYVNPSTHVGHDASEISPGVFGAPGESSAYSFPGNLTVGNTFLLPGGVGANGIFWGSSRSVSVPHLDYNPSDRLLVSAGAGSPSPVNFENNVFLNGNLDASNISVVSGYAYVSQSMHAETVEVLPEPRCSCDVDDSRHDCSGNFPASESDPPVCYDYDYTSRGHTIIYRVYEYSKTPVYSSVKGIISARDFVAGNSIALGGVSRTSWPAMTEVSYWSIPDGSTSYTRTITPAYDGYALIIAKGTAAAAISANGGSTFKIEINGVARDWTTINVPKDTGHVQEFYLMYLQEITRDVPFTVKVSGIAFNDGKLSAIFIY